jgi:hypothetical protein
LANELVILENLANQENLLSSNLPNEFGIFSNLLFLHSAHASHFASRARATPPVFPHARGQFPVSFLSLLVPAAMLIEHGCQVLIKC